MDEAFSAAELELLDQYVTNTDSYIFALRNLPEVVKGALFSRYSRSPLGLRLLLLKEFLKNEELGFDATVPSHLAIESQAIKKAQQFYDRILDGYGDDSIGELGGAHLAVEQVSLFAAKAIEECRIGGSPLEKSTRYVYFDQKVGGEYPFYRDPILMTSAYRDLYLTTCNQLFDTYSAAIPPLTELFAQRYPAEAGTNPTAYKAALRAKVLDALRGLLPAATLTNLGVYGNGRYFEGLLHKLQCHPLAELQEIGRKSYEELAKVIPSFVRRAEVHHHTHQSYAAFEEMLKNDLKQLAHLYAADAERNMTPGVKLIKYDPQMVYNVTAALLYPYTDRGMDELRRYCLQLPEEAIHRILEAAASSRESRRHKSPRALEIAFFLFEIVADYGAFRDLQRHRMATLEKQLLTCDYGYDIPEELKDTPQEEPYVEALLKAQEAYYAIATELPEEAQYVVPQAYRIRWHFHINLRALQWLCELRSSPAGHPSYRLIAQEMARQVCSACPLFERFFKFVDFEGYSIGRLSQEERNIHSSD